MSNNHNLQFVNCSVNEQLTELDVSGNPGLQHLDCIDCSLTSIILPENGNLHTLFCAGNDLMSLDLTRCPWMQILYCQSNQLTEILLNRMPGRMEYIDCQMNYLSGTMLAEILNVFTEQGPPPAEGMTNLGVGLRLFGNETTGPEYDQAKAAAVALGWRVSDEELTHEWN